MAARASPQPLIRPPLETCAPLPTRFQFTLNQDRPQIQGIQDREFGKTFSLNGIYKLLNRQASAASVAFRIDMDARPATRCWPVDAAERRLPQVPQDTLRTGEPYVFSLADIGRERTAGVTWELGYTFSYPDLGGDRPIRVATRGGTSFPHTFTLDDELRPFNAGWYVRCFVDANRNGIADFSESAVTGAFKDVLQDRKGIWLCRLEEEKKAHAGTIYNEVFGVTAFFDQLIARVKNVSFGRNHVGTAKAIYDFMPDTIGVNDARTPRTASTRSFMSPL